MKPYLLLLVKSGKNGPNRLPPQRRRAHIRWLTASTYGGDIPIEESGNMVVLAAAIAAVEGNADYAQKHWETLTTWTDYLVEYGLDPRTNFVRMTLPDTFAQ